MTSTQAHHLAAVGEADSSVYAVLIPQSFRVVEGVPLWKGVRLGKFLGAGAQAKVYRLVDDEGKPTGNVVKINHGDFGSQMLNNNVVWVGMDREWEIGTQLRAALQEPGSGRLPNFMKVHDCLLSSGAGQGKAARFRGMVMGEIRGWEVYKRIITPEFHNINFVREMLFQVFSALDRAQRALGFVHSDLALRNVMEHYPRLWEDLPAEEAAEQQAALRLPGYTMNADGSRLPLGPEVEFVIIDFGISKFSTKVAAAAAGHEAQEVVEAMHDRCRNHQPITFRCADNPTSIELQPTDVTRGSEGCSAWPRLRALLRKKRAKFTVRQAGQAVQPEEVAPADLKPGTCLSGRLIAALDMPTRLASCEAGTFQEACKAAATAAASRKSQETRQAAAVMRCRKKKSPVETMYRGWWHRKGDVFHLLLTLALALDDRTWPEEDEDEVLAFCSLVHHVTGVKMRASFAYAPEPSGGGMAAGVAAGAAAGEGSDGARVFGRSKWQHWFRRWQIRLKCHFFPYNSGLLAREALSHPFFGAGAVRHAKVPWHILEKRGEQGGVSLAHTGVAVPPSSCPGSAHVEEELM